ERKKMSDGLADDSGSEVGAEAGVHESLLDGVRLRRANTSEATASRLSAVGCRLGVGLCREFGLQLIRERTRLLDQRADGRRLEPLVVHVDPAPPVRLDLHELLLEEPGDPALKPLALARDDGVGTQLLADLRKK